MAFISPSGLQDTTFFNPLRFEIMAPFLPQEIIKDILKRLPVKSLIRFQCTCKHWKNLIKTPSFISDHLHHSSSNHNTSIIFQPKDKGDHTLHLYLLDCEMQVREVQKAPLMDYFPRDAGIVFTSNGLVCVKFDKCAGFGSPPRLLLWNPATRDNRQVPTNISDFGDQFFWSDKKVVVGFGFSPIINDYKIVMFCFSRRAFYCVEVYSLASESWKEVKCGTLARLKNLCDQTVTANGIIYWFGWLEQLSPQAVTIVSFDIANEVFTLIPTPVCYANPYFTPLTVHEDRLALLSLNRCEFNNCIEVWVMDEAIGSSRGIRSWTKKYTCFLSSYYHVYPLTIWRNEIFFTGEHKRNARLTPALFNFTTNKVKQGFMPTLCNLGHGISNHRAFNYVESLVPIGGTKF